MLCSLACVLQEILGTASKGSGTVMPDAALRRFASSPGFAVRTASGSAPNLRAAASGVSPGRRYAVTRPDVYGSRAAHTDGSTSADSGRPRALLKAPSAAAVSEPRQPSMSSGP